MYFHHTMTRNFAIDPAFSWDLFTFIAEKAVFFLRKTILLAENGIRKEEKRFAEQMMSKAKPYEYRQEQFPEVSKHLSSVKGMTSLKS